MNDESHASSFFPELRVLLEGTPVDALELSVRARNCLDQAGCKTLWETATRSDEEWMKIRNLGRKTLVEIKEGLAAFIVQCPRSTISVNEKNDVLPASDRELLKWATHKDPCGISPSAWTQLVTDLEQGKCGHELIGVVAARIGIKWPANRYDQRLSDYLFPDLALLWRQGGLGKTKIRAVIQCALSVWAGVRDVQCDATVSRSEILATIGAGMKVSSLASSMESAFATAGVSKKEREILFYRYGIPDGQPRTLESVGEIYGVTRERVRQIQEIGLRKLIRPPDS